MRSIALVCAIVAVAASVFKKQEVLSVHQLDNPASSASKLANAATAATDAKTKDVKLEKGDSRPVAVFASIYKTALGEQYIADNEATWGKSEKALSTQSRFTVVKAGDKLQIGDIITRKTSKRIGVCVAVTGTACTKAVVCGSDGKVSYVKSAIALSLDAPAASLGQDNLAVYRVVETKK
jgi:hypothetical protein